MRKKGGLEEGEEERGEGRGRSWEKRAEGKLLSGCKVYNKFFFVKVLRVLYLNRAGGLV